MLGETYNGFKKVIGSKKEGMHGPFQNISLPYDMDSCWSTARFRIFHSKSYLYLCIILLLVKCTFVPG